MLFYVRSKHRKSRVLSAGTNSGTNTEFVRSVSVPADRMISKTPTLLNNIVINMPTTPDLE